VVRENALHFQDVVQKNAPHFGAGGLLFGTKICGAEKCTAKGCLSAFI